MSGKACDAQRRTILRSSFRTLQRGNAGLDALRRHEDAERPETHATRSAARSLRFRMLQPYNHLKLLPFLRCL
ncbi:hypothetical protein CC205_07450 [Pseudomonas savastanoi pv. nerii]|uniref:DUF1534 domain-containing protein n=1 Tax=Pseudomonas savastanoi pv. nerii TaxID=360921 RepID=A0AB73Q910_PSESS|nr:hypothetical protein CCZ00_09550 [Pseudomonas savastanoi pv. fraxini]PAB36520.1 hypothetical protein CC205_07450 [Pseudomonas savastanoi pv. nerii]